MLVIETTVSGDSGSAWKTARTPSNFASSPIAGLGRAGARAVTPANATVTIFSTAAASGKSPTTITAIFSGRYQVFQKSTNRSRVELVIISGTPITRRLGRS